MPLQQLPVTGLDDINHQRRHREITNKILTHQFDDSKVRTPAEIAAGVAPVNYAYPPGVDLRYGVVRDNSTDNQVALTNLIAVGAQGVQVILTPGIAVHSDTLDWSFAGLRVYVEGKSQLRHTGTGIANRIDGAPSGGLFNIIIDGYLEELGSASTTHGWYLRELGRCRFDLRAKNATQYGCLAEFIVSCDVRFLITADDGIPITTQPTYGLALNHKSPGEQVAFCRFPNVVTENLTSNTGILLASCLSCVFESGSSENCNVGIECNGSENFNNSFMNFDLEQNITRDVTVSGGSGLSFYNCQSVSSTAAANISLTGGDSTSFFGGFYRWIDCVGGGATNSRFFGIEIPNNLSVGITGSGTRKSVGVQRVDTSRVPDSSTSMIYYDEIGETGTFTPAIVGGTTPGTQAYAANSQKGYFTRVGKRVDFSIYLVLTSNSGGTGAATITGLPFASRGDTNCNQPVPVLDFTGVTLGAAGRAVSMRITPGLTTGFLIETDTGSVSNTLTIGAISGTAFISINGSYQIA